MLRARLYRARRLTPLEVEEVLATVEARIARLLRCRGLAAGAQDEDPPDAWAAEAPVLAGLAAASVQGTATLGPRRGVRPRRLGEASDPEETVSDRLSRPSGEHEVTV